MQKKLIGSLGLAFVFALGCATGSVLLDEATASPEPGSHRCVAFPVGTANPNDVAKGKTEEKAGTIPAGWTPLGAAQTVSGMAGVVACRAVP